MGQSPTDAELCAAARAGKSAVAALVARYEPMVMKLVRSFNLPGYVERDDLTQVGLLTIARIAESATSWQPDRVSERTGKPTTFFTYVYRAVLNDLRREAGKLIGKGKSFPTFPDADHTGFDPFDQLPQSEKPAPPPGVREKVANLTGVLRTVVELHYGLDGTPAEWREIADRTGLTIPQAKRALAVALSRL